MAIDKNTQMTWTDPEHRPVLAMLMLAAVRMNAEKNGVHVEWDNASLRAVCDAAPRLIVDLVNMLPSGYPKLRLDLHND